VGGPFIVKGVEGKNALEKNRKKKKTSHAKERRFSVTARRKKLPEKARKPRKLSKRSGSGTRKRETKKRRQGDRIASSRRWGRNLPKRGEKTPVKQKTVHREGVKGQGRSCNQELGRKSRYTKKVCSWGKKTALRNHSG